MADKDITTEHPSSAFGLLAWETNQLMINIGCAWRVPADYYDAYDSAGEEGIPPRPTPPPRRLRKGFDQEEEEYFSRPRPEVWESQSFPCDRQSDIFVLQQHRFIHGDGFMANGPTNCSRPYFVKRIPYSNLVLVVVNTMYPSCFRRILSGARPVEGGNDGAPCHKLQLAGLPRRRLEGCYTDHPLEIEVEECGRGGAIHLSLFLLMICWIFLKWKHFLL